MKNMKHTLRLNAKVFPVIGLFALVMQVTNPARVWVILLMGFGVTWLVCWVWARGLLRALTFEREMRFGWAQVGDHLEERFTLTNTFSLPATSVTVLDHSNLPDHYASLATGVDGDSRTQWTVKTQCTRRGVYTLGGTTLETGDPLGLYTLRFEDPTTSTLAVMPPVVTLPRFLIPAKGSAGEGRTLTRSIEETLNASHTREMAPNDPLRLIHWKSTARHGKFFVRQFEGTPAGDWWLLLDLDRAMQVGAGADSTEEHGVILAASLAAEGLKQAHPVGLAVNGKDPAWIVPRRNEYQQQAMLKALAVAAPGDLPFEAFLARLSGSMGGAHSLLIITANTDPTWTEALMPLLWRGVRTSVFVLDPASFGGERSTEALEAALQSIGAECTIIPRELLDADARKPGSAGEWEWRVVGTGKAVAVKTPVADWRRLA